MKRETKRNMLIREALNITQQYTEKLTVRQIFYRLLSKGIIKNNHNEYKAIQEAIKEGRIKGQISFNKIEDRSRYTVGRPDVYKSPEEYFDINVAQLKDLEFYWSIPKWHNQPKYVEVWLEKKALQGVFESITNKWNVLLAPSGGYSSLTYLWEATERWEQQEKKDITILLFGDYDMRGLHITQKMEQSIREDIGFRNFNTKRIALNKNQIEKYDLPPSPAKTTDSMARGWIENEGNVAWELDAIEPEVLKSIIDDAIAKEYDFNIAKEVLEEQKKGKELIKKKVKNLFDSAQN